MISGYVPFYNAQASVGTAIASILNQNVPIDEIVVIDDGSTDHLAVDAPVNLIRHESNRGRGAARATAMAKVHGELVLGCDATLALHPECLQFALPWFEDPRVAAVFGWVKDSSEPTLAHRWRNRHVFRSEVVRSVEHRASLSSGCSVLRRSAVGQVGGFNSGLREGEDRDLGERLIEAGFDVVFDPSLWASTTERQTVLQVMERYTRWNSREKFGWSDYLRQIGYSIKVMAIEDIRAKDPVSILPSLLSPHYQFWNSWIQSEWKSMD